MAYPSSRKRGSTVITNENLTRYYYYISFIIAINQ